MHMCDNSFIFSGRAVQRTKANLAEPTLPASKNKSEYMEQKGYLLIRELWNNGTDIVHDICVLNTDTKSYLDKTPEKCLQEAYRAKKNMYLE